MKEFNLNEYLKDPSKKVVTRDGREVRIICTDMKSYDNYKIVTLVKKNDGEEVLLYRESGRGIYCPELDLFFAPVKKEGWVNIFDITRTNCISRIYKTKEEAETIGKGCKSGYITTIKIEWEE